MQHETRRDKVTHVKAKTSRRQDKETQDNKDIQKDKTRQDKTGQDKTSSLEIIRFLPYVVKKRSHLLGLPLFLCEYDTILSQLKVLSKDQAFCPVLPWDHLVLCCVVLCCAVLCCAVLCCAELCCAVLCCAVLCCAVL